LDFCLHFRVSRFQWPAESSTCTVGRLHVDVICTAWVRHTRVVLLARGVLQTVFTTK